MNRHPVIFGFLLLAIVGLFFFLILRLVVPFGDETGNFSFRDKIGVVSIEGVLGDADEPIRQLDSFEKDDTVKAVVLRINSPGGAVVPSQEIYEKVLNVRNSKKVVVSMGSVAASGGYYIACAADRIIANPGTITGSIGYGAILNKYVRPEWDPGNPDNNTTFSNNALGDIYNLEQ